MEHRKIQGHQVGSSAIIEKDGKFLLIMDPNFKVWRVPGGRADHGETVEEIVIREMKEETQIDFENPLLLGFGQDQQMHLTLNIETSRLIFYFHLKTDQESIFDPKEASDHKWVTWDEFKAEPDKEGALDDLFCRQPNLKL